MRFQSVSRLRLLAVGLIGLISWVGLGFSQDQSYTVEQYNEYQKAKTEGCDSLISFVKANPECSLNQYAVNDCLQFLQKAVDAGDHQNAVTIGEKFLAEIDSERFEALFLTTWAAFNTQQFEKAAQYGEKAYSLKPETPQLVPILARSYLNSGDVDKALPYAEKLCATASAQECYDLLPAITRHYAEKKDWQKAAAYARKTIKALDEVKKPPQVPDSQWKSYIDEEKSVSYAIVGRQAAEAKNWRSVEPNYRASRRLSPKNRARTAEGYYYIGMAKWTNKEIPMAMEAFARGAALKGTPHSGPCRKELERLYRATHNGSLAGFDEYLGRYTP